MQIYLSSISGWEDAFQSMFMSRGTWTPELMQEIKAVCATVLNSDGTIREDTSSIEISYGFYYRPIEEAWKKFCKWRSSLFNWGTKHITLLKFMDFCFVVQGLHRGGTDDWDAHAERYSNRIVRLSTRLSAMKNVDTETNDLVMSDYYTDKVLTLGQVLKLLNIELPEEIQNGEDTYVRSINGYVREDLKDNHDAKRGLYPLGFSNLFIFKCNLIEYAHVRELRMRKTEGHPQSGHAHPELWDLVDMIDVELEKIGVTKEMLDSIKQ